MSRYVLRASWMAAALLCLGAVRARAQDPADPPGDTPPPERVHGWLELSAPEGQDGSGLVKVRQVGERLAIHVMVWNLEPGAVYAAAASRTVDGITETAALGSITTRPEVPPLPWCFSAKLAAPVVEEPPPEGEGAHHGDGDGWGWWPRPPRPETGGFATFHRNADGTELHYSVRLYGVGDTAAVVLQVTAELALPLIANEDGQLRGTLVLDPAAGVIEALAAGGANVVVTEVPTEGEPAVATLEGAVKSCFPMLDRFRARMAQRLAGTGALRLDTERGDAMPFGIVAAKELVGASISVSGPGEVTDVVLSGTFADDSFRVCPPPRRWPPVEDPAEGGGASFDSDEDQILSEAGLPEYFGLPELHDARFVRGDVDDDGSVGLSDAISSLTYLFRGGAAPYCADAADANDSGSIDVADPILTLLVLFRGEGSMASPFPAVGSDRTADDLFCRGIGG